VNLPAQPVTPVSAVFQSKWMMVVAIAILAVGIGLCLATANWALALVLLALPAVLIRPRDLCLGAYAFLLPFDSLSAVGPAGQTLTSIVGAGVALILLSTSLLRKDLQKPPRQAWWWVLFVGWAVTTALWAISLQASTGRVFTAISLLLFYLVVLSSNISRKELRTVSMFAIAGALIGAVYTAYQFFIVGVNYHDEVRGSLMSGTKVTDPNYFAASLLLPLSLAITGFLTPRRWLARMTWLAVAGTLAFGILVTMSRGAVLSMIVLLMFYVFSKQVSRRMTIPLIAIFVALALAMPSVFMKRIEGAAASGGAGRTKVWRVGMVAFEHYGVFGAGLNNFSTAFEEYVGSAPMFNQTYSSGAHNTYLEIAVETGSVGLILMLTAFVAQLRAARRRRQNVSKKEGSTIVAYEAACYSVLASAFFIGIMWEKWFWMPFILLAVAVRTSRDTPHTETRASGLKDNVVMPLKGFANAARSRSPMGVKSGRPAWSHSEYR
jgi:O-Antigen ligase